MKKEIFYQRNVPSEVPSRKKFCNLSPAVSEHMVGFLDGNVFLCGPGGLLHARVKVIVPPLTTLLAVSTLKVPANHRPLLRPIHLDQIRQLVGNQSGRKPKRLRTKASLTIWGSLGSMSRKIEGTAFG